jgi:hypothetical protein
VVLVTDDRPVESPRKQAADEDGSVPDRTDEAPDDHLQDLPDGSGCTEIWEHLAERRAAEGGAADD